MKRCFVLLNHNLSDEQKSELKNKWNVSSIIYPNNNTWRDIEPMGELNVSLLDSLIDSIKHLQKGDLAIIQGEFGATYYMVNYCINNGIIPIYATSQRVYKEIELPDKSIKREHIFKHINFRKYKKYN